MYRFNENNYSNWPKPGSFIMWLLGKKEEADPSLVDSQAEDIAGKEFSGVLIYPRGGTLDYRDPGIIDLFSRAAKAAKDRGMDVWLMADPRLASNSLIHDTGECLEVILTERAFGYHPILPASYRSVVTNDGFLWEFDYPELRHTHIHQSGGMFFTPYGVDKVYALKLDDDITALAIRDITDRVSIKIDLKTRKVNLYGSGLDEFNGWDISVFPRFKTNFFDYSNPGMWAFWEDYIGKLFRKIDNISGICWDEPGFYTDPGTFPMSKHITDAFKEKYNYSILDNLHLLKYDSPDFGHIRVRIDYYALLNDIIVASVKQNFELIRKLSREPEKIMSGIHATWHGEFCGIEEKNHGSMDIWSIRPYQTAAFSDIGEVEKLVNPENGPDVIYSFVLARSLSRLGPNRGLIYSNLWGINYGRPGDVAPIEVLDYWSNLLDLFETRWIAHGYGWPGSQLKDLNFGPGYPGHPTWDYFNKVNLEIINATADRTPGEQVSDILMVFPLETFYAFPDPYRGDLNHRLVKLVDNLARTGYQVDLVPSSWLKKAKIVGNEIHLNGCPYYAVIVPCCEVMTDTLVNFIKSAVKNDISVIMAPGHSGPVDINGKPIPLFKGTDTINLFNDPVARISELLEPTFTLPKGSLANVFRTPTGHRVHLIADRPFGTFGGIFKYGEIELGFSDRTCPLVIDLADE